MTVGHGSFSSRLREEQAIRRRAKKPMDRALIMQRIDDVDITFGGLCCSTGDVIIVGQHIVGLADGIDTISSCGIFNIVASKKVRRESAVAGKANVIICPDINVGNIGVKLVQNFAHADAYGPFLQGFKKIVCDCSRSAPVSELVGNVVMSCVRAQALKA